MSQKTSPISYPGELPELDHQTISLRTQLRLSYETYSWLRYISWTGLLLVGVLLFLLPGGFPPYAFVQFWQVAPEMGQLLALHGSEAVFSLAALGVQALTWFVLWALLLLICLRFGRYTWHLYRSQTILASSWQPSLTQGEGRALQEGIGMAAREQTSQPAFEDVPEATVTMPNMRAASDAGQQTRQFAQASFPALRQRAPSSFDNPAVHSSPHTWPILSAAGSTGVAWDVGITRRGRPNEDSVLALRGTCNFADRLLPFELHIVADGMGGHAHGRLASHLAIRGMLETVVPGLVACNTIESEQIVDILIDGVHWANQVIYQYGQEQGADMGTTITCALLLNDTAYIINVGDSRTYVYRPGVGLTQITRDHSLVARLVETGAIQPDDIYTHPERNKVYRGLGDKMDVTVDWFVLPVQAGDVLLLCSDGLWEMVRDVRIADILQTYASAPSLASHALLRSALQAGGSDNVSLLVARVQP